MKAGYVRYVGASSMYAQQFARALYTADLGGWSRFVSMQNHYNLLYREEEREMLPLCRAEGVGVLPWSPLARGHLARPLERRRATERAETDEYARGLYDFSESGEIIRRVGEVAAERDASRAQVALAWLLGKDPVVAPIVGATELEHLEDALGAVELDLTDGEEAYLEEPYPPREVQGHE